jgi:hypothetical protein
MSRFRIVKNLTLIVVPGMEIAKSVTVALPESYAGEVIEGLKYRSKERERTGVPLFNGEREVGDILPSTEKLNKEGSHDASSDLWHPRSRISLHPIDT